MDFVHRCRHLLAPLADHRSPRVAAVAKRHGLSEQTIHGWKKRFGTFEANDVGRLKQLERWRVASGRPRPNAPNGANQVWAIDFIFDACANGLELKMPDRFEPRPLHRPSPSVDGLYSNLRELQGLRSGPLLSNRTPCVSNFTTRRPTLCGRLGCSQPGQALTVSATFPGTSNCVRVRTV